MKVQQSAMTAALRRSRIIPVITISDPKNAVPLASALLTGGLPIAEIALRTPGVPRLSVPLDVRSLSFYDVPGKQWRAEAGDFKVLVGSSSADIKLAGTLHLANTVTVR